MSAHDHHIDARGNVKPGLTSPHSGRQPWEDEQELAESRGSVLSDAAIAARHEKELAELKAQQRTEVARVRRERERELTLVIPCHWCGRIGLEKNEAMHCATCQPIAELSGMLCECGADPMKSDLLAELLFQHPTFKAWMEERL